MDLQTVLATRQAWLTRHKTSPVKPGEQNTKVGLIAPILEALGWDTTNTDEVFHEYRRRSSDNPVDYALLILRKPALFVEAKGFGEKLADDKWSNQTVAYATSAGVEWVVLTDGFEWRIYNAHAPVPIEEKLFRVVRITDPDAHNTLTLLSKASMAEQRISGLWRAHFIDSKVKASLEEMFNTPDPELSLVNLIAKHLPEMSRADVKSSLARVRGTFDFPLLDNLPSITKSASVSPKTPRPTSSKIKQKKLTSLNGRKVAVTDLLDAGYLKSNQEIKLTHAAQTVIATIQPDSSIVMQDGTTHNTLSSAGRQAKLLVRGPDTPESTLSTDGWAEWHTAFDNEHVPMDIVRRAYILKHSEIR